MNGKQRLAVLADWLETRVEDDQFSLRMWSCGTTACAIGHGAMCPALQAEGLYLDDKYAYKVVEPFPVYNGFIGFAAASYFFDITTEKAVDFFALGEDGFCKFYGLFTDNVKPRHVAAAIRDYLGYAEVDKLLAEVKQVKELA